MTATIRLSADALRDVALHEGVCIRPVMHEVYDTVTKSTQLIPTPCGATRERKCPPWAERAHGRNITGVAAALRSPFEAAGATGLRARGLRSGASISTEAAPPTRGRAP